MKPVLALLSLLGLTISLNGQGIAGTILDSQSNVLLNSKKSQGCIFTRRGVEANWDTGDRGSPAMYLTVQK